VKTTWNIIKSKTGKKGSKGGAHLLNMNGYLTKNQQMIANPFNNYFLTIADTIIDNRNDKIGQSNNNNNPVSYMLQIFKHPFPNIKFNHTSTNEIEKNY
jgi:hypothetical protein